MIKIKNIGLSILSIFLFPSCEDVIDLKLESIESRIVIEATIDASNEIVTAKISKTNDFYENRNPEQVSSATLSLISESGDTYTFSESSPGNYLATNVITNPGETFDLLVEIDGVIYHASTQVPSPVKLDTIIQADFPNGPFSNEGDILLTCVWEDPKSEENFYRIRTYIDDIFQSDSYMVLNDAFTGDGQEIKASVAQGFYKNTRVVVELLSISESYYDYFFQLSSLSGDRSGSPTPYNPKGNFSNEALGYFGAFISSSIEIQL
jgi:hypothetical protein